ncbi:ribonuclease H-like domain-containing protein [Mycena pura]|uniref:Ribonuclease H-like domain-containing protein n=1 Tax=Mycena pura TaxID=153505 RepID=A0AAD6Y220_9AGAR|nr:ribonuclease H-like domain-containing protein [Mycena pura]
MTNAQGDLWLGKLPALLDGLTATSLPLEDLLGSPYEASVPIPETRPRCLSAPPTAALKLPSVPTENASHIQALITKGRKRKAETNVLPARKRKAGPKPCALMDKLSVSKKDDSKTTQNKHYWECIADACSYRRAGRRCLPDVTLHAQNCKKLEVQYPDAHQELIEYQAATSLSSPLAQAEAEEAVAVDADSEGEAVGSETSKRGPGRPKKLEKREDGQSTLDRFFAAGHRQTQKEREIWQAQADHWLMLLICKCGLDPDLINSDTWKGFINHLNPLFETNTSSHFINKVIPAESAKVKLQTKLALQKAGPSTLALNRTQSRKESFYTLHGTTPVDQVYFLGGHFGAKESHTAEYGAIKSQAMRQVGESKWAAIVSDSTNVTLPERREITKEIPTVLDLCDVVHFLQHVIEDITNLTEFATVRSICTMLMTGFNFKSGKAKANLKDAGVGKGKDDVCVHMLAKIGKTRFATHYMAAVTIEPALEYIQELVAKGVVSFKTSPKLAAMFEDKNSLPFTEFARDLLSYQRIIDPLARSLWSLEATTANPSDALVFWIAAAHTLESIFTPPGQQKAAIPATLAGHVRAVFNARYHQFFSQSDVYFVAFCLDPRYPNDQYLRERKTQADNTPDHIRFSHAFMRVKKFLRVLLKGLIDQHSAHATSDCKCHPILKEKKPIEIVRECLAQLNAFWLGEAPFHTPVVDDDVMEWWENFEVGASPQSGVLAMLAVRIFGILVNSMPDERTNSNITWLNSPLRGNQKAENLLHMETVGQWYTYHAEGVKPPVRRRPTVAFRRLDPALVEKVKLQGTGSDTDSESDSELESTDTVKSAENADGVAESSDYDDEKVREIRRRLAKAKRASKKKGKKSTHVESDEKFAVDEDINFHSPGLEALLTVTDEGPTLRARKDGGANNDVIDLDETEMDAEAIWSEW